MLLPSWKAESYAKHTVHLIPQKSGQVKPPKKKLPDDQITPFKLELLIFCEDTL